jgi:hypothetical protein
MVVGEIVQLIVVVELRQEHELVHLLPPHMVVRIVLVLPHNHSLVTPTPVKTLLVLKDFHQMVRLQFPLVIALFHMK